MFKFIEYFCLIVININFNNTITFEGEAKKKEKGPVEEKTVEKGKNFKMYIFITKNVHIGKA